MPIEQQQQNLTAASNVDYTPFTATLQADELFVTRDTADKKVPIDDLFMHFTANVIQENKSFIR